MTRDDLEFDVHYSFRLEKMNYILYSRIDKLITLSLVVLGFSVFSPYTNYFYFGVGVAILSVLQLVYQFAQEAGLCKEQVRQLKRLILEMSELDDRELKERFSKIQDSDSNPWQSLEEAAFIRACIVTGREVSEPLTYRQGILALLAGDWPKIPEKKDERPESP